MIVHNLEHDHLLKVFKKFWAHLLALSLVTFLHFLDEVIRQVTVFLAFQGDPETELLSEGILQTLGIPFLQGIVDGVFRYQILH